MDKVRLGDYIVVKTGKLDANAADENGMYPFFTCSQTPLRINDYAFDCECVLIAGNGDLNVKYYNGKFNAYQRTYVITADKSINLKYLYHFFEYYIDKLRAQSIGGVIKYIRLNNLTDIMFNLYDLETQREIVEELDCLSDIIEKKKQQLADLDNLVKSRFIEMFGNENNAKYKQIQLSSLVKYQQGTQVGIEKQVEKHIEGYQRFLRIIDYTQPPQEPRYVNVKGTFVDEKDTVIVRYGATAGFIGRGYSGVLANNLFVLIIKNKLITKDFLYSVLKYGPSEEQIKQLAFGAAMPALSFTMMDKIYIVLPPIELQNQFVSFIEKIDKSKVKVQQSIRETQNLFNERMQHYFGE